MHLSFFDQCRAKPCCNTGNICTKQCNWICALLTGYTRVSAQSPRKALEGVQLPFVVLDLQATILLFIPASPESQAVTLHHRCTNF